MQFNGVIAFLLVIVAAVLGLLLSPASMRTGTDHGRFTVKRLLTVGAALIAVGGGGALATRFLPDEEMLAAILSFAEPVAVMGIGLCAYGALKALARAQSGDHHE